MLLFDADLITTVLVETKREGRRVKGKDWKEVTQLEMKAFIGLCILRGVYRSHSETIDELWSEDHGRPEFRQTIGITRFRKFVTL